MRRTKVVAVVAAGGLLLAGAGAGVADGATVKAKVAALRIAIGG